jgi:hypothetical protein
MKIFLQDKGNSAFIKDLGGAWTESRERAHAFSTGLEAVLYCFEHRMSNMQMVGSFVDPRLNFSVSVTDVSGN